MDATFCPKLQNRTIQGLPDLLAHRRPTRRISRHSRRPQRVVRPKSKTPSINHNSYRPPIICRGGRPTSSSLAVPAILSEPICAGAAARSGRITAEHTLTRICSVEYIKRVESVFEIIAEPNRRAILSLLVSSQQSVGEIERQLRMPQPTVSKHLRVLREAGFVESTVDAQRRLYRLKPEPLQEMDAWLAPFRRFWSAHVDALERHLDRMDQSTHQRKGRQGEDDAAAPANVTIGGNR